MEECQKVRLVLSFSFLFSSSSSGVRRRRDLSRSHGQEQNAGIDLWKMQEMRFGSGPMNTPEA